VGAENLVLGAGYNNVSQCALVLENNPVGADSRLAFESFPEDGFEESYGVAGYREIGADRMPQPGFVAYRGGNWSAFSLDLKFRAEALLGRENNLNSLTTSDLEGALTAMERKARWCQALCFPLERAAANVRRRLVRAATEGKLNNLSDIQGVQSKLTRNDPPFVLVVFGSFLTLRCYCTGYSIKWEHPFHPITAQPYGAVVTLQFQRLDLAYPNWHTIRDAAGALPQSSFIPSIPGNVVVRNTAGRTARLAAARSNAAAASDLRGGGGDRAASISVGPT